ncbi:bsn [Symbiodinium sp. CCMP2456]|nr:bsn [Symbiodinium sp. CCMP2456]
MSTVAARRLAFAHVFVWWAAIATAGPWDAPASYYNSATGTGATLKSQLHNIIDGHTSRSYGDLRTLLQVTDADPDNPGHILLVYDRVSLDLSSINSGSIPGWDSGNSWNREHTWPQSLGVGSGGPDTSDMHHLRPSTNSVNNARGNKPFGGSYGQPYGDAGGGYWYPGDADAGMIARGMFYMAVRYDGSDSGTGNLELVNGSGGGSTIGDLASLLDWHYRAAPDGFERRRNDIIFDSYQYNRNPFIDHPEYAWSVFVDQQNDTQLSIAGATASADGSSTRDIDLGRVFVGGAAPSQVSVGLDKNGMDGTYFQVTATGAAFTNVGEYSKPVPMGSLAGAFDSFDVGLNASTAAAGSYTGSVIVENLDVTTAGGAGRGANDGNDVVNLAFDVVNHAVASFTDDVLTTSLTIDFGQMTIGSGTLAEELSIFNFDGTGAPAFAADLDIDSVAIVGDGGMSLDLSPTFGVEQGAGVVFDAIFDTSSLGEFANTFTIHLSDEDLVGAQLSTLSLTLLGEVIAAPGLAGDYNGDGRVDAADYTVWRDGNSPDNSPAGYDVWAANYGESIPQSTSVPEPTGVLMVLALFVGSAVRTARVA